MSISEHKKYHSIRCLVRSKFSQSQWLITPDMKKFISSFGWLLGLQLDLAGSDNDRLEFRLNDLNW